MRLQSDGRSRPVVNNFLSLAVAHYEHEPPAEKVCLENATVRGRAWYKPLDAPVLTLDVTVLSCAVAHLDQDIWSHVGPTFVHRLCATTVHSKNSKGHRLLYHSTLGSRVIKKQE